MSAPGTAIRGLKSVVAALSVAVQIVALILWSRWAYTQQLARLHGTRWLAIVVAAVIVSSFLHQCCQAIFAWCFQMKLMSFNAGPLQWRKREGKWVFQFRAAGLMVPGGCVSASPASPDQSAWESIVMIAAGPAVCLLTGGAATWAVLHDDWANYQQTWEFVAYSGAFLIIKAALNLIPFEAGEGSYSDGACILQIVTAGRRAAGLPASESAGAAVQSASAMAEAIPALPGTLFPASVARPLAPTQDPFPHGSASASSTPSAAIPASFADAPASSVTPELDPIAAVVSSIKAEPVRVPFAPLDAVISASVAASSDSSDAATARLLGALARPAKADASSEPVTAAPIAASKTAVPTAVVPVQSRQVDAAVPDESAPFSQASNTVQAIAQPLTQSSPLPVAASTEPARPAIPPPSNAGDGPNLLDPFARIAARPAPARDIAFAKGTEPPPPDDLDPTPAASQVASVVRIPASALVPASKPPAVRIPAASDASMSGFTPAEPPGAAKAVSVPSAFARRARPAPSSSPAPDLEEIFAAAGVATDESLPAAEESPQDPDPATALEAFVQPVYEDPGPLAGTPSPAQLDGTSSLSALQPAQPIQVPPQRPAHVLMTSAPEPYEPPQTDKPRHDPLDFIRAAALESLNANAG